MEALELVNSAAAATTVTAAVLVASNYSPKIMVTGFVVFCAASFLWIASGLIDDKSSLVVQNVALLAVNVFGIWRWLPKAS